jgi:hypothetical protein
MAPAAATMASIVMDRIQSAIIPATRWRTAQAAATRALMGTVKTRMTMVGFFLLYGSVVSLLFFSGHNQGGVLEASLMSPAADLFNLTIDGTLREPGESDEGAFTEASSPWSSASISHYSDDSDVGTTTEATSMCSSGSLSNFSIIDSTLREGEQFATAYFDTARKIKIVRALDDFGYCQPKIRSCEQYCD